MNGCYRAKSICYSPRFWGSARGPGMLRLVDFNNLNIFFKIVKNNGLVVSSKKI